MLFVCVSGKRQENDKAFVGLEALRLWAHNVWLCLCKKRLKAITEALIHHSAGGFKCISVFIINVEHRCWLFKRRSVFNLSTTSGQVRLWASSPCVEVQVNSQKPE